MILKTGNRLKNILTGKVYEVKKINKEWVLLQAEDGLSQVLTGKMGLKFMYVLDSAEDQPMGLPQQHRDVGHGPGDVAQR